MKLEIKRFKIKFANRAPQIIDSPHPDEAIAQVRREHGLSIGERIIATETKSRFIEI